MIFFDWLKRLFGFQKPLTRDVSRLAGEGSPLEKVEEIIDQSGGPLKEGHRRRALRDPRLLPKTPGIFSRKRKKVFSGEEARRLFAGTLRTNNRNLRDLLADEEQLRRHGLPVWKNEDDLARDLGMSVKELRFFSIHRQAERIRHYVTFSLPKRSGGRRLILAPKRRLKSLQRKLLALLVRKLPLSEQAHGFRMDRSIRTGAELHVGKKILLHLDLQDFFPSVTFARVRGLLIALGYGYPVATTLAVVMTEAERQPVEIDGITFHVPVGLRHCVQGAPTSPGLCNCLALRLDRRLAGLARKWGFTYSRYADDLTFSGDESDRVWALKYLATRIIHAEGFQVNEGKTRISRQGRRQQVTGVIVNRKLGLSRQERRRLRAMIHHLRRDPQPDPVHLAFLRGKLAFLNMLNPAQAAVLRQQMPMT